MLNTDYSSRSITIIGSTGSIGTQSLEIAEHLGINVTAIAAGSNIKLLEQQIRKFRPKYVAVNDLSAASALKAAVADCDVKIFSGAEGICEIARIPVSAVITSLVGAAGLRPTMAAIEAGNNIALANKETLVAAGELVMSSAKKNKVSILPVDSEHSAVFQSLHSGKSSEIKRILLTASGGPFFGRTAEQLKDVTAKDALKHPNWSMGAKITIDCATLMNKGLEEIEAMHLFSVTPDMIEVVVHRESIVHSMVEFCDNSVIAQMGAPDMRLPIQYALTYPDRVPSLAKSLDFYSLSSLTFARPDCDTFRCLKMCEESARRAGLYPAAVNAANEVAVARFLNGEISFLGIADTVERVFDLDIPKSYSSIDEVIAVDEEVRKKLG